MVSSQLRNVCLPYRRWELGVDPDSALAARPPAPCCSRTLGGRAAEAWALGSGALTRRTASRCGAALSRRGSCLARELRLGGGAVAFPLQRAKSRARPGTRHGFLAPAPTLSSLAFSRMPRARGRRSLFGRGKIHTSLACLRQPDGDRLFRRTRAVLPLANVFDLLAHEFTGLRRGRAARAFVVASPLQGGLVGHTRCLRKVYAEPCLETARLRS